MLTLVVVVAVIVMLTLVVLVMVVSMVVSTSHGSHGYCERLRVWCFKFKDILALFEVINGHRGFGRAIAAIG